MRPGHSIREMSVGSLARVSRRVSLLLKMDPEAGTTSGSFVQQRAQYPLTHLLAEMCVRYLTHESLSFFPNNSGMKAIIAIWVLILGLA